MQPQMMQEASLSPPSRPNNFNPSGRVAWAEIMASEPDFIQNRVASTGAQYEGMRYERKVQSHLLATLPDTYVPGPWLRYYSRPRGECFCQPDGWIVDAKRGVITIVEIKLRHTANAWWQIRHLYEPVTQRLFGTEMWDYAALEICRWYDPATPFPEQVRKCPEPGAVPTSGFNVHIWRGRSHG